MHTSQQHDPQISFTPAPSLLKQNVLVRARRVRAPATDELQWATGMDTSPPALRPEHA
jgi:hypothetical protein